MLKSIEAEAPCQNRLFSIGFYLPHGKNAPKISKLYKNHKTVRAVQGWWRSLATVSEGIALYITGTAKILLEKQLYFGAEAIAFFYPEKDKACHCEAISALASYKKHQTSLSNLSSIYRPLTAKYLEKAQFLPVQSISVWGYRWQFLSELPPLIVSSESIPFL